MVEGLKKHHISFRNALAGLGFVLSSQPNFKIHLTLATIAVLLGFWLNLSFLEMTVLLLVIFLALSMEMVNTAMESITDLVTSEWRESAKIAKDVSAGMMLLTAMGATLIGLLLLGPKLVERLL